MVLGFQAADERNGGLSHAVSPQGWSHTQRSMGQRDSRGSPEKTAKDGNGEVGRHGALGLPTSALRGNEFRICFLQNDSGRIAYLFVC